MRNYSYQSILSVCREFGANNWESLLFYPKSDLEMWLQTLKALPDEKITAPTKEGKAIRTAMVTINKAIHTQVPRAMKDDHIIIAPYHVERHSKALTRDDIDRMYAAACKMIARDTQERKGKVCLGKRQLLVTLEEFNRRRGMASMIMAALYPFRNVIDVEQVIKDKDTSTVCEKLIRCKQNLADSNYKLSKVMENPAHTERQLKTAKNRVIKHKIILGALSKLERLIISIRQDEQARVSVLA